MKILTTLFGEMRWTPPAWLQRLGAARFLLLLLVSIGIVYAVSAVKDYYASLPQPPRVVATVSAPPLSRIIDGELQPQPLLIRFTVKSDPRLPVDTIDSVARLDLLDTAINSGITMQPSMPGRWKWRSESELQFEPDEDWPAGQDYTVQYDASLFAANLDFERYEASFTTQAFSAQLDTFEFYQDPVKTDERKIVATLSFSHPVNKNALANKLRLLMRSSGETVNSKAEPLEHSIRYDETNRTAYIHSETIQIPEQDNFVNIELDEGLTAASGPSRHAQEIVSSVRIPSASNYFRTRNVRTQINRGENSTPLQTLLFEFTDQVRSDTLQEKLSVWVLPKTVTVNGIAMPAGHWRTAAEVSDQVLSQAEKLSVTINPTERDAKRFHSAIVDVPEHSKLYIRVEKGLESDSGFTLSRSYNTLLSAPAYPREVSIAQDGALLPLSGDHKLTFISRGVDTLRVNIGRLLDNQLNHLASQTGGDIKNPYFSNYRFNENSITSKTHRYIDLHKTHPKEAMYSSLDLSEFLPDGGYYFIEVQGWNKKTNRPTSRSDRRFVLITDMGLLVKSNADSSHDVFVHSIATGEPIAGAKVELLGKNGIAVITRHTSADGRAGFPVTKEYKNEKEPTVFMVRQGLDSVFIPFNRNERRLQYSRFDTGGEHVYSNAPKLRAQLFTDRGIYRPGETVNLAAIIKDRNWRQLDNLPLQIVVDDPRGQRVLNKEFRLPRGGLLDRELKTEVIWPTGEYKASLYLIEKSRSRRSIAFTNFRVEEFQPDRLRINSEISTAGPREWIKPEGLTALVSLQNLFGTPAQSRRVTAELRLEPAVIRLREFGAYTFTDPLREPGTAVRPIDLTLPETTTDAQGNATLPLPLDPYDQGVYQLTVLTECYEEGGGRSVRSRASAMLSPLDHLVGYKSDSDLSWISKDSQHTVEFIAVNSKAEAIALENLTLELVEQHYVSTLIRRSDGTYAYDSILQDKTVSKEAIDIAVDGLNYPLPSHTPGSYRLKILDSGNRAIANVAFTVAGNRNFAARLERNAELQLKLNGSNFHAGDEIELEITAPYTGTGLITIERDRVYAHEWFKADTTNSVQRIRVPAGIEGNAYVNVAFVRELNSPEVFVSPLSFAVQPFSIDRRARTIDVELQVPERVRPGETINIDYRASQSSKMIIYAVDEGILQFADYEMPDPLQYFLPKMALQVNTFQMIDLILPAFSAYVRNAAPGGGEGGALAGKNLNPFRRKTEPPVVFWSGVIDAGPLAQNLQINVPDYFNGELRVMAIAVNDAAVGRQQQPTTVRGPFVLTPNLLTAAAPGDKFEVNVGIANNLDGSGLDATIEFLAEASAPLEIVAGATQTLQIGEGRESSVKLRVKAGAALGAATLSFTVSNGEQRVQREATLSVRPQTAFVATVRSGSSQADPIKLKAGRTLHKAYSQQSLAASASPLLLADGMIDYLSVYPHACAEQTVSKVFPQLALVNSPLAAKNQADVRRLFGQTISKLRSRQTPLGGFRFWASSREPHDFSSVYITHFLSDAREMGLPVPARMLADALDYLQTVAGRQTRTLPEARLRAYAIYMLTRNEVVTTNYLSNLHEWLEREHKQDWRQDISAAYMAASYELLKQSELGAGLIAGYTLGGGRELSSDFDTRLGRDAQYVYLVAKHFPARLPRIGSDGIENLVRPIMQNRFNTLSAAYTTLALRAWSDAIDRDTLPLQIATAEGEQLAAAEGFVKASFANQIRELYIHGANGKDIYYQLSQTGFDAAPASDALAQGMEVQRSYLDDNGNPVTTATIGTELTVRLRVRSTTARVSNVAVVDLLPGGFEVLTDTVPRNVGNWHSDHIEVREDRVVIYGSFGNRYTEFSYRVKLTGAGRFAIPSVFATSMYDSSIQARSKPGTFTVHAVQ